MCQAVVKTLLLGYFGISPYELHRAKSRSRTAALGCSDPALLPPSLAAQLAAFRS